MSWDCDIDNRIIDKLLEDIVLPQFTYKVTNIKVWGVETKSLQYYDSDYFRTIDVLIIEVTKNYEAVSLNYNKLINELDNIIIMLGQRPKDYSIRYKMML